MVAVLRARAAVQNVAVWERDGVPTGEAVTAEREVRGAGRAAEQHLDQLAEPEIRNVIGEHLSPLSWLQALHTRALAEREAAIAATAAGDEEAADAAVGRGVHLVLEANTGLARIACARRDALTALLAEHGVRTGSYSLPAGHPGVAVVVAAAGKDLPAGWVERSATAWPPLAVQPAQSRGSYGYGSGLLTIGADGDEANRASTATHELGHRMVATTPDLQGLSVAHHHGRVVHSGVREQAAPLPGHPDGEITEPDEYGVAYCGRTYADVHAGAQVLEPCPARSCRLGAARIV